MKHQLDLFHRVVSLDYRPWLMEYPGSRFRRELEALTEEKPLQGALYVVTFPRPLNDKRMFFWRLIGGAATSFLNGLHKQVQQARGHDEKARLVQHALNVFLHRRLHRVCQVIFQRRYRIKHYRREGVYESPGCIHADDAYILFYVKHQLVRLYLEVQERYARYLKEEPKSIDDVYQAFFDHNTTGEVTRCMAPAGGLPATGFEARTADFRAPAPRVLTWGQVVKDPGRFALLEQELFASGYLTRGYAFVEQKGHKTQLAMIVVHLARKGYFNKRIIPGNQPLTLEHIRRFMEHRYQVSLVREMRKVTKDPGCVDRFVASHYWLENLRAC